jgi:hypothetical protein
MAEVESQTGSVASTATISTVVIRAKASVVLGSTRDAFWSGFRSARHVPDPFSPTDEELEHRVKQLFPQHLQKRFETFLRKSYPPGTSDPATEAKRQSALAAVRFSVADITYGSIDIKTVIENLDQILDAFALTAAMVTTILSANAPGALSDAIAYEGIAWDVELSNVNIQAPPPQQPAQPGSRMSRLFTAISSPLFLWQVLNALWILPIVVSLLVLIFAYREFNRITEARDTIRSNMISDEIGRADALYKRFDEKHAQLLQAQEKMLKESSDAIRAILSQEIERTAARSSFFDQQQGLLLQRYENLFKENSEIIKALIQKPDSCCVPDCKKPKDRCQKSSDSK